MLFVLRMLLLAVLFVVTSVIGLLINLCRPFNPDNSRICARLYGIPAQRLLGIKVNTEVQTLEHHRPCVIIANHQSNYDLFVLGGVVPSRTVSVGKKSLKWIPLFGQLYWLAGNVLLDRSNPKRAKQAMLDTTETLQKRDTSIWIFPEGTRNQGKGLLPFKKGAFLMAINAGVPIVPVCVSHYAGRLQLNKWCSAQINIRALPALETRNLSADDAPHLLAQCEKLIAQGILELETTA